MSLESLSKRIKTTEDLRTIVSTMKSLSSASILQYEKAQKSLESYIMNIKSAFHILMLNRALSSKQPSEFPETIVIIIGADNGLVGKFNKELLDAADAYLKKRGIAPDKTTYLSVGKRIALLLEQRKREIFAKYASSNSIKAVGSIAASLIIKMEQALSAHKGAQVVLFFHKRIPGSTTKIEAHRLWPFSEKGFKGLKSEKWPTNNFPTYTIPVEKLKTFLIREYLTIFLTSAITMSLAAEHYTRMLNMQNAEKNIDEKLGEMNLDFQQKRQEAITDELIDIISGANALSQEA